MPTPCILCLLYLCVSCRSSVLKHKGQTYLVWPFRLFRLPGFALRRQGYPPDGGFVFRCEETGIVIMHTSRGGSASSDCKQLTKTVKVSANVRTDLNPNRTSWHVDLQRLPSIWEIQKKLLCTVPKRWRETALITLFIEFGVVVKVRLTTLQPQCHHGPADHSITAAVGRGLSPGGLLW
jgi:hypothetical protein